MIIEDGDTFLVVVGLVAPHSAYTITATFQGEAIDCNIVGIFQIETGGAAGTAATYFHAGISLQHDGGVVSTGIVFIQLLSMANNFDPLSANKIDPPGA